MPGRGDAGLRPEDSGLTAGMPGGQARRMSFLLPQTRTGTVATARVVDIHGDRYVDLAVAIEGAGAPGATGRVSVMECPEDLTPGERVAVRFTMGVMTRVERATS